MQMTLNKIIIFPRILLFRVWRLLSPLISNDKFYLSVNYFLLRGKILHWSDPKRFNEKLQWLKLHTDAPERVKLVDKYEVKNVVKNIIGEKYIIPTYGVWNSFDDINFDKLPDQFVLKCTHDSGGVIICDSKSKFDIKRARKKLNRHLKVNFFYGDREYGYKEVPHRIIAEKYMVDESGWQLKDYKVFCFNGEPKFIEVDYDRYVGHKLNVYDLNWNYIDFYMTSPNDPNVEIPRPKKLEEMLDLCRKLSEKEIFVRVDFYSIGDEIYFGELTYFPGAGVIDFHPDNYDYVLGEMLELPDVNDNVN